jgi:hypothetical protein
VLTVIVTIMTITGRYICSPNIYCDNNGDVYMLAVILTAMTITISSKCTANSYCDNNVEVYMQY